MEYASIQTQCRLLFMYKWVWILWGLEYAIRLYGIMRKPYTCISKPMLSYPSKLHKKNRIDLSYHVICLMTSSFEFLQKLLRKKQNTFSGWMYLYHYSIVLSFNILSMARHHAALSLPSPVWAEGTVLSWFVCVCVCVYVCLSVTTKLLFKLNYLKIWTCYSSESLQRVGNSALL